MDAAETDQLLAQVRDGDRRAFEMLFARHRDELLRFVKLRLDPRLAARVDASDIVQEAQLEAFRRLEDYSRRQPMPFRLWLCKTAQERLVKNRRRHLQAARRNVEQEVPYPERSSLLLARQMLAEGSTPSRQLSRKETAQKVAVAVATLPEADREILLMRHVEEREYGEIAHLLEIDAAAARKRYGRALLRVRKALCEAGILEP
jgi:RNA polymerase sigma-70 factor (ECF subfamily)